MKKSHEKTFDELINLFVNINTKKDMENLFQELFTEKEREDITLRLQLMKELHQGKTQRSIAEKHRISLCKITRGSKLLKKEDGFIKSVLDKHTYE